MEFKQVYYQERVNVIDHSNPVFAKDKINIINPQGHSGILTLWSKPEEIWKELLDRFPGLFERNSPLVALTSLYGNGLPQMLANLAYNPQVEFLAVTGNDTKVVPSYTYLTNFLERGIEYKEGEQLGKISGTSFSIDPQLRPDIFRHLRIKRFKPSDLENLVNFVTQEKTKPAAEEDRIKIELIEPVFSDFPSDITSHQIIANTPLDAWMDVMYRLNRFGDNIQIAKRIRRTLFDLDVHIEDPAPEKEELLRKFNFDPNELQAYREDMLKGELPENTTYTYGNRIRRYFGVDTLEEIVKRLRKDPLDRRLFVSLWDTRKDMTSDTASDSSVPCLTDLYFVNLDGRLMLTANFRTHNAVSAWLLNLYGLRSIQEYVAERAEVDSGKINVKSRWISIDPDDGKVNSALELIENYRKIRINVNDLRGYFVIGVKEGKIFAEHYSQNAEKLTTYTGKTAVEIKDQIRQDSAISDPDHAMWVGHELARAHYELHGELLEL